MKIKYLIIMLLLTLPLTIAYTEVQWSSDNTTWKTGGNTDNDTILFEELVNGVDADTTYFFRARHRYDEGFSNWTYTSTTTLPGGFDEKMFSIIFGITIVMILCIFVGANNKGTGVRYLFFGYALIQAVQIFSLVYLDELGLSLINTLKINLYSLALISFGVAVYGSWKLMVKLIAPDEEGDVEEEKWQDE